MTANISHVILGNILGPDFDGFLELDVYSGHYQDPLLSFYQVFTCNPNRISRFHRGKPTRNLPEKVGQIRTHPIKIPLSSILLLFLLAECLPSTVCFASLSANLYFFCIFWPPRQNWDLRTRPQEELLHRIRFSIQK